MKLKEINQQKQVVIYCDLDGCLVDFDAGVKRLTGKFPSELKKSSMWKAIYGKKDTSGTPDFFVSLEWESDGKQLWNAIAPYHPTILTGLPTGGNGEGQKREWCDRELGKNVPVIVCASRDKHLYAKEGYILIDDRNDNVESWKAAGGIGILHRSTEQTLKELKEYV